MKKWLKNLMVCLLLATMVVGLFGCSGGGQLGEVQIEHEGGVIGGDNAALSYPLDTDVELSIYTVYSQYHESYVDATQSPWHIGLEDKTGVKVNWRYPVPGADTSQAFSLLMTQTELPDIIGFYADPGEGARLIEEGAIIDLTPFLPVYAPDYWAFINEDPERLKSVSTADGKVYIIGYFTENEYTTCAYGPIVRKDWLEECNLDIPVTMADWEEMLTAFKQRYGAKFAAPKGTWGKAGLASGCGAFSGYSCQYYLDDGEVKFSHTQPEYKEYLTTLNRWVKNNLLDIDSLTMTNENFRTKAMQNQVGAAFVVNSLYTNVLKDTAALGTGADWIAVPYPVPEEGDTACWINMNSNNYPAGNMISADCPVEEIATALRWLNYGFSKEGLIYFNYGEEGLHHVVGEDGTITFTPMVMNDPEGAVTSTQRYTAMGANTIPQPTITLANTVFQKNNPKVEVAVKTWLTNQEAKEHLLPEFTLTAEERSRHADLFAAFATMVNEITQRIIVGQNSVDDYDKMVKDAYSMGLQEALDIQNAAYQRWLKQ